MKIAVNAMQVRAAKSGVGQYIHALLDSALKLATNDEFVIYCNAANESNYVFGSPNSQTKIWGLQNVPRAARLAYEATFLPSEIISGDYSVFHGTSNFLPARRACPYVVTIHDLSYHVDPSRCPPVRRYYWYAMTRRTVALADAIITISENSRRDIVRFFPETESRIRVIPQAAHHRFKKLDLDRSNSEVSQIPEVGSQPYLLYLGTLEPGKNVARIITAFDSIASRFPEHNLILAGDKGWLFQPIFDTIASATHRNRIHYIGHVTDLQAVHLFNFADAFVFPSMYEGFGLPPLEAMACGCPVITSNRSSIPEVVGDAAIMVNPESVDGLAAAMSRVLESPALRNDLAEAGLNRSKLFSWDKTAAATLDVYRQAAEK